MRWPWRRRRKDSGRVFFIGTSPFDVAEAIAAVPTPSPVVSAWVPDEPPAPAPVAEPAAEPAPEPDLAGFTELAGLAELDEAAHAVPHDVPNKPAPAPVPEPRPGVQLGFADGSVMTLEDDDPRAIALRAAAARLTGTG